MFAVWFTRSNLQGSNTTWRYHLDSQINHVTADYRDKSTWEAIISLLFMIVGSPFELKVHHQTMAYTCKQECHPGMPYI